MGGGDNTSSQEPQIGDNGQTEDEGTLQLPSAVDGALPENTENNATGGERDIHSQEEEPKNDSTTVQQHPNDTEQTEQERFHSPRSNENVVPPQNEELGGTQAQTNSIPPNENDQGEERSIDTMNTQTETEVANSIPQETNEELLSEKVEDETSNWAEKEEDDSEQATTGSQPVQQTDTETRDRQREEQITFEQNFAYEQSIKEGTKKMPLVCVSESINELLKEYEHGSEVYRNKIQKLAEQHGKIRRCRGDGNCFYRAFAFAWLERLLQSRQPALIDHALAKLEETKKILDQANYQQIYDEFYEVIHNELNEIKSGAHDSDMLLCIFQTDDLSNRIVYYLRLLTAAYLKLHRDEYEPFLETSIGMDEYCRNFVEVMDQEADHIHVTVLTQALKVPVEIAYMSGSNALEEVNFHEFYPEETGTGNLEVNPYKPPIQPLKPVVLLYRPGHYDVLYRKQQ